MRSGAPLLTPHLSARVRGRPVPFSSNHSEYRVPDVHESHQATSAGPSNISTFASRCVPAAWQGQCKRHPGPQACRVSIRPCGEDTGFYSIFKGRARVLLAGRPGPRFPQSRPWTGAPGEICGIGRGGCGIWDWPQ